MTDLLRVESVSASYDGISALRNVRFSLARGELCALLGLNGCGKTTLLRCICALRPFQGECLVAEQSVRQMRERERARLISFIPQSASALEGRTALSVALMGANPRLGLLQTAGETERRRAREALAKVGLQGAENRLYAALSQGQKQLVILARSLVQDAPVMLMDEPDSALDFQNRQSVLGQIRDLVHRENRCGLLTLHDPNLAMAYCDRLLLMRQGAVIAQLDMRAADTENLRAGLSQVYGDVALFEHGGHFYMEI